jgi:tetratricopeptide (TPR) repeat protein
MEKLNILKRKTILLLTTISFASVSFVSSISFAEKMDAETHSMVIDKLERAMDLMEKDAPERTGVMLRLGDLYSDRARLKGMEEVQKNCEDCQKSKEDRIKALAYYQDAFPKTSKGDQGKLLVQMAHLNNMNGNANKAGDIYKDVIEKGHKVYSSAVIGASYFNIGEAQFRKGNFKQALSNFDKANKEDVPNRAFIEYRRSWCLLNLGKFEQAIAGLVKILKDPQLSSDQSFKEDVSRDLATFLAHGDVSNREIQLLRSLSPEKTRKSNIFLLGTETDRLGKKSSSLLVWTAYANEGEVKGIEKLEIQIRVAQSQYDLGRLPLALTEFGKATNIQKNTTCEEKDTDKCAELKTRMRNFVLNWNKAQKVKPTIELLRAYQAYISAFEKDFEMLQWAALVARELKQYRDAVVLFRKAALSAKNDKSAGKILEGALLGEIEMAESSKDLKLREDAYTFYLETRPQGPKAFEARFERAHVWYEQSKHQAAFSEFHYVATSPGSEHRDLKIKAADLALDCLVLLKDDKSLEVRANEYARLFPERQKEYSAISRKASLNQVAQSLNNQNADRSTFQASLIKLKSVNMAGASDDEKVKYWKNRILVATQAHNLAEVRIAAEGLLSIKKISESDREYALEQKAWAAELQLDFKEAYKITKTLKMKHVSPADRDLRLGMLAELSGANPTSHFEDYLRHERSLRSRNLTRITLVKRSNHPWAELNRQLAELKRTPDLLAPLALEVYGREPKIDQVQKLLTQTSIGRFVEGKMLARQANFGEFEKFKNKIASHHLKTLSDSALKRTLNERMKLLADAEKISRKAVTSADWTMEMSSAGLIARENRRLGQDILRLPIPKNLSKAQREQYRGLMAQQANPYLATAQRIEGQLNLKWNSEAFNMMEKEFLNASWEIQNVLKIEIQNLAKNAPQEDKNRLFKILKEHKDRPSSGAILTARKELQQDPFNTTKIQRFRELEHEAGQNTMVSYLDARLSQMKQGNTL